MAETETQSVVLPPIVDLDALDDIRDELLEALVQGAVTVDATKVERVATNAVLMLMSAAETAKRSEFKFEIKEPSAPVMAAVERLGLNEHFAPLLTGE